eukprot:CAMPEP_0194482812 /NCGR_PEP_ID=MMETSP0253-20130528/4587_1 /TAXON_ID=2966 /ORGANISM="Noctiluca scintillans" /LENGTH=116 /DNA_ID=CAMNT_0039322373 /DNA_START=77 /DNA_END=427 /DNA_ORIENTATION=-
MGMKYLGAYLMAVIGGKSQPTSEDVKKILEAAAVDVDKDILDVLITEMSGKSAHELIAAGLGKFESCGGGGGGGGAAAASGGGVGGAGAGAGAAKEEEKKVEEEEEEEEMDFDLFG